MNNTHPIFQDIIKNFQHVGLVPGESIMYRGYIIEPTSNGCPYGGYDYYPASEGRNDDADCAGDPAEYHYTGNVGFASSIDNAKDAIMERIMEQLPAHVVIVKGTHFPFAWLTDAIAFAVKENGDLRVHGQIHPIVNP